MTGLRRFANRRDKTESVIFDALRTMGCLVYPTNKPVDAIVQCRGTIYLVECKTPLSKAGRVKTTPDQDKFIADGWHVFILTSAADAVEFVQSLTRRAA